MLKLIVIFNIKRYLTNFLKIAIVFIPWVGSIYVFYWLDYNIWTFETNHRGKISVIIMLIGMYASLYTWDYFEKNKKL